jgi:dipeptidyl aminopeptidase/acylaminoacyl peptidase
MKRLVVLSLVVAACGGTSTPPPAEPAQPAAAPSPAMPPPPPPAVGKPKQDLIPRAVLFGNPERTNVQISPDGKHLSWIAANAGVLNVFVAPIDKLDAAKPITNDTARPVRSYVWAQDNKHVLYIQDKGGDENWHVFRADLDGGAVQDLTPYDGAHSEIYATSPKRPTTVLIGINDRKKEVHDFYAVDITSGKRTLVYQNDDGLVGIVADDNLVPQFASRPMPDGSSLIEHWDGKAWSQYDSVPFADAQETAVSTVLPNGTTAYATESRNRDTTALVELDIKSKKAKVIAEDPRANLDDTFTHPTKHTILAAAFNYDRVHWRVLDKTVQADFDGLAKLAEGGDFAIASTSLDFKTWIVSTSTPQHPGHYFVWDHAKHTGAFLFAARPELEKQPLVGQEAVVIPARDGLPLVSYLTKPANASGPVPLVMLVHGGPWGRDNYGFSSLDQLLANRGYAVLQVNYRGSAEFGKKFIDAGNLQWGKHMHDDILDAMKWAIDQGITTKDKVAIMGGSYGGYETLAALTMTPDVFACGVDIVGPSNLLTLIATVPPYWAPLISMFKNRMGDWTTPEGKAVLVEASPLTHATAITKPLLIGQGANDPRVKQAESEQIVSAMNQHGLPVTYIVFPDEGHGFARPENNIAFFAAAEAFLSAHLGGYYLPVSPDELKASSMQIKQGQSGIPGF